MDQTAIPKGKATTNFLHEVLNPARIAALARLGLMDTPAEFALDRLGNLAAKLLHAPVALVSLVDDHRQFFKSCVGLPEPWATWRNTPLSHSFCQHVVATSEPLVIPDAREDPLFQSNLAIHDLGVIAYLGIPLRTSSSHVLGSFCVIDSKPRQWTHDEITTVTVLADCVMTELELRSELKLRKAAEAELRSINDALQAFGDTLAHDLRAPLRHIQGFAGILRDTAWNTLQPDAQHCISAINNSAAGARMMVEALAVLGNESRQPLQKTQVDITQMARDVIAELQSAGPCVVTAAVADGLHASGDPAMIRVLLENLIGNAWKFCGGSPSPSVSVELASKDNPGCLVFCVRDNGVGFPSQEADKLFSGKARLSTAKPFPGTGLGLHTAKRIVERHGGRIWAESGPQGGASFYFTLGEKRHASQPIDAEH